MRVFDPRDQQWKESNNPALMVAQLARDAGGEVNDEVVSQEADHCDQIVTAEENVQFAGFRSPALFIDPRCADLLEDLNSVQYSNLHDNSCAGRVCLNPAHMAKKHGFHNC